MPKLFDLYQLDQKLVLTIAAKAISYEECKAIAEKSQGVFVFVSVDHPVLFSSDVSFLQVHKVDRSPSPSRESAPQHCVEY